jgi:FMN-dependent NADH-azoreductase
MKKILHIISSPRGSASFSIQLGNAIVEKLKAAWPGSTVKEYDLVGKRFPHLEEAHITSFFTPPQSRTPENIEALQHSDEAIRELFDADIIVIGAPMYNYSVHSSLKAWLDHIGRAGVTFSYGEGGPKGLVTGKKVYIAMSSGGIYSEGPMQDRDFVVPYLKTFLGFIGMTDVTVVRAEGTSLPGVKETALEKGINSIAV